MAFDADSLRARGGSGTLSIGTDSLRVEIGGAGGGPEPLGRRGAGGGDGERGSSSLLTSKCGFASTIRGDEGEMRLRVPRRGDGGISRRRGIWSVADQDASRLAVDPEIVVLFRRTMKVSEVLPLLTFVRVRDLE